MFTPIIILSIQRTNVPLEKDCCKISRHLSYFLASVLFFWFFDKSSDSLYKSDWLVCQSDLRIVTFHVICQRTFFMCYGIMARGSFSPIPCHQKATMPQCLSLIHIQSRLNPLGTIHIMILGHLIRSSFASSFQLFM